MGVDLLLVLEVEGGSSEGGDGHHEDESRVGDVGVKETKHDGGDEHGDGDGHVGPGEDAESGVHGGGGVGLDEVDAVVEQTANILGVEGDLTKHHQSSDDGQTDLDKTADEGNNCLLYTSDAADEEDSVDLGGRRIIKKKKKREEYTKCEKKKRQYRKKT
eukprot:TRINITY_DN1501_c0_g1_i12.p1 TRINITY_DN1501_c0_g1~~TRINITY_DN1501_c0_g1_i12.p1  ORF type:complete len:160 (-),score=34.10 TRINITY_DN1501_c0_g1_i12:47-526(-)